MSGSSPFCTITNDQVFIQTEEEMLLRVLKNTVKLAESKDGKWEYYEFDGKIGIYNVEKDLTWEFAANEKAGVHKLQEQEQEKKETKGPSNTNNAFCWGMVAGITLLLFCVLISNGLRAQVNFQEETKKRLTCNGYGALGVFDTPKPPEKKVPTIPRYARVIEASDAKRYSSKLWLDKAEEEYFLYVSKDCDIVVVRNLQTFHKVFNNAYGYERDCYLTFQNDGNLVLYHDQRPLWSSGTHGQGYTSMYYDVENKSFKFF